MKQTDRLALLDWEKYKEDIARATPVDRNMTAAEREKHREYLEKHPIEWIKFFFPNYAKYEFADFQKRLSGGSLHTMNGLRCFLGAVSWPNPPSPCSSS